VRIDLVSLGLLIPFKLLLVCAYRSVQIKLTTSIRTCKNTSAFPSPRRQDLEKLTKKAEDAGWY